ncbi:MAG: YjgP/YjgQ family permease [Flavobacteriales bacterium]|nr:YjgP/YjgQ family permease [Flavobacteriales bacterium]
MLKKIDAYIIKKFLGTFVFILALLMTIAVVFDISEKMDDFLDTRPPLSEIIFKYYLNFVIHYGNLFTSLIIFIALIWFTSKMAQRTEIIAILSSGVSFARLLRPFFIAATIMVVISLVAMHFLVPYANKVKEQFEQQYIYGPFEIREKDHNAEIRPGEIAYFRSINYQDNWGSKFSIGHWEDGKLTKKLFANYARFDSSTTRWKLENYYIRSFEYGKETLVHGSKLDTVLDIRFSDFGVRKNFVYTMTTAELKDFIEVETLKGSDKIPKYEIEIHQRTSYPVATYILTLIGVSVAGRKVRGGMGLNIVLGLLIAILYIFAMKIMTVSATNAGVNPFIAVWTPNALFALIAVYLYIKAPK